MNIFPHTIIAAHGMGCVEEGKGLKREPLAFGSEGPAGKP